MPELDRPNTPAELYQARGPEVEAFRPVVTGDIFRDIIVPGVGNEPRVAMVLAHPCSMRAGAHLKSHVQMAVVDRGNPIAVDGWTGNYGAMPLPDLDQVGDLTSRAMFELAGRVPTDVLHPSRRIACLSQVGILLLLQRLTFHMTRYALPLEALHASIDYVLVEVELLEDWMRERLAIDGSDAELAQRIREHEQEFDRLLSESRDGVSLRKRLRHPHMRADVRRSLRAAAAR